MRPEIPELDRKGLREFGLTTGGILGLLFGLFFPWLLGRSYPYWPWVLGGLLALLALFAPDALRQGYRLWMRFALLLSRITTPVTMGIVFLLVITPAAWIMRIMAHDPMARRFDPNAESYRIPARKPPKAQMERPF
jgi:saxitoxin biosynthesis operon SxtJ-like protein